MLLSESRLCRFNTVNVQHNNVNFKGLNKALSTRLLSTNDEIDALIIKYPRSKGAIGTLPKHWTMKTPPESRGDYFRSIVKDFGNIADTLRGSDVVYRMKENALEIANHKLYKTLHSHSIIKTKALENPPKKKGSWFNTIKNFFKSQDRKVQDLNPGEFFILGHGAFGRAFAFKDEEKTYVLKVFHNIPNNEFIKQNSKKGHFKLLEPNRAAYIKKNTKSNEFAKFYFADLNKGFMITEYIDKRKKLKHRFSPDSIGVKYTDTKSENQKDNSIIDYGGIRIISANIANNKTAQWVYNKLVKIRSLEARTQQWHQIFEEASNNIVPNSKDRLLGLVACLKLIPGSHKKECLDKIHSLNLHDDKLNAELNNFYDLNPRLKRETI